jgi:cell wall-associated NlpC family hydrolase
MYPMKNFFPILLFCFSVVLPAASGLAQEPSKNSGLGIVSAPLANVHEDPLTKSRLETQVLMGDEVHILEKQDNRYRITIPSQGGREGWIQQEAVQVPKDKGKSWLNANRQWIVVTVPKTEALILDRTGNHKVPIYAGTRLPLAEKSAAGRDYKVLFPDRSIAVITASEAMPAKTYDPLVDDTRPEDIEKTAKQFQGAHFQSGGITVQGIDTIGLIYISYRVHGIPLGTDRASLKAQGERVAKKDLETGDILVFAGEGSGLTIGNGRFLHAPKKTTVQVAGIHDQRYANALQYGVRVIGARPDENKRPFELTADEILLAQARAAKLPLGKRIAYWAARFVGTPYDPDPLGLYVRSKRIVADEKVDCMYHAFRSVELAKSNTPGEAIDKALTLRFLTTGKLTDGLVTNYDERFQYGEDMVMSNKWGKNVTAELGAAKTIPGSRGKDTVDILPKNVLLSRTVQKNLQDGDIIFWVKDPKKRVVEEIVAHLSVVHIKSGRPYIIHAAGSKSQWGTPNGGVVKEVPFSDYVRNMRFIGAFVTRFEQ